MLSGLGSGWDTVLSRSYEGGVDLSGGQWQRIALARALFAVRHGATILVLDEPTAWLDARGEADFFDRFLEITEGTTTLIISHRFSTVRRADHICVLDGGRVTEQGDHDSLIAAGKRYAELFAPAGGAVRRLPDSADTGFRCSGCRGAGREGAAAGLAGGAGLGLAGRAGLDGLHRGRAGGERDHHGAVPGRPGAGHRLRAEAPARRSDRRRAASRCCTRCPGRWPCWPAPRAP